MEKEEFQTKLRDFMSEKEKLDWKSYNQSQTREKTMFIELLYELTNMANGDSYTHNQGRKPMPSNHMLFCMCMKIYLRISGRRLISDLEILRKNVYIQTTPHFNSLLNYFHSSPLTKKLHYLIGLSALPLANLESQFAIDSTGIATTKYKERWSVIREKYQRHREYKKVHAICGCKTNVIPSVIVTDGNKADSPYFQTLLQNAAQNFDISQISADPAYLSRSNMQMADSLGITPYILFKKNSKGHSHGVGIWNKMYRLFKDHPEKFLKDYHQRSNIESSFMMLKQRCGDYTSFKDTTAQINEILCKVIVHNLTILVQEIFLSGIEVDFIRCARTYRAQEQD